MKYLIKTIKHTTGEEFTDIIRVKNNEDYIIVEAESKEEAERISLLSSDKNKASIRKLMKIQRILG